MTRSPITKHTLWLREGDMTVLRDRFPAIGGSAIIRGLVSKLVDKLNRPVRDEEIEELVAEIEAEENARETTSA